MGRACLLDLATAVCLLGLAAACSDGGAGSAPDAARPLDAPFVICDLTVLPAAEGYDLDGDGTVDNAVSVIGSDPQGVDQLFGAFRTANILIELSDLGSTIDDDVVVVSLYLGADVDGDPANNWTGSNAFGVAAPLLRASGVLTDGRLEASLGDMPGGPLGLRRFHSHARLRPDLMALDEGVIGAVVTVASLSGGGSEGGGTTPPQSALDILAVDFGAQPDIDLDGDGLETFLDADGDLKVDRCTERDGTVAEGTDCPRDPRFADGYSLALGFSAMSCELSR